MGLGHERLAAMVRRDAADAGGARFRHRVPVVGGFALVLVGFLAALGFARLVLVGAGALLVLVVGAALVLVVVAVRFRVFGARAADPRARAAGLRPARARSPGSSLGAAPASPKRYRPPQAGRSPERARGIRTTARRYSGGG